MPQVKALMTEGESFSNFFVSNSLCCPSRTTILRGEYSHNTLIYNNVPMTGGFQKFYALQEENSTVATWLHAAGYRTALIGKYLNGYPLSASATYVPPGWDDFVSPVDSPGYSEYNYTLNVNGKLKKFGDKSSDYGTKVYGSYAAAFIKKSLRDHVPFFLFLAPVAPHTPAVPARQDLRKFPNLRAPRTASFNEADVSDKPKFVALHPLLNKRKIAALDKLYRKRIQSLQAVDRMVGDLKSQLETSGALENTFLFFSSDNGFHLGQHRLDAGKITAYDEDIHVPLIVRGPRVPKNGVISALALNTDLAPTWLEMARVQVPELSDGRSLVPLWSSDPPPSSWRNQFALEYGAPLNSDSGANSPILNPTNQGAGFEEPPDSFDTTVNNSSLLSVPAFRGFRTNRYKFVHYATGEMEFYDLQADPNELQNLAKTLPQSFVTALMERLNALEECAGPSCRAVEDEPAPLFQVENLLGVSPLHYETYPKSAKR